MISNDTFFTPTALFICLFRVLLIEFNPSRCSVVRFNGFVATSAAYENQNEQNYDIVPFEI